MPERSISEAVLEELTARGPWSRVLIPRAEEAREVLPEGLRAQGAHVDVLPLYRTVAEPLDEAARAAALGADYLCFTSASSVTFFQEAAGTLDGPRLVTIGPVTSDAVRKLGFDPHVEATQHDPDGLVAALVADAATAPKGSDPSGAGAGLSPTSAAPRPRRSRAWRPRLRRVRRRGPGSRAAPARARPRRAGRSGRRARAGLVSMHGPYPPAGPE